jgi:hypothetical protein
LKPLLPNASRDEITASLHELFVLTEQHPDQKGALVLDWFKALPPELFQIGFIIYGLCKERPMTGPTFNITGNVANFNLGQQYGAVTATVNSLAGQGAEKAKLGDALAALAMGVNESELEDGQKAELLEGLNTLGEQATAEAPKRFTISAILKTLPSALAASSELAKLWAAHGDAVVQFFHHLL